MIRCFDANAYLSHAHASCGVFEEKNTEFFFQHFHALTILD